MVSHAFILTTALVAADHAVSVHATHAHQSGRVHVEARGGYGGGGYGGGGGSYGGGGGGGGGGSYGHGAITMDPVSILGLLSLGK